MNENKEKMPVRYKRLDSGQGTDFNLERSLDLIFSPGCFTVEIDHSAKDVGLPIEFCGSDHYIVGTLMVTDNGVSNLQPDKRLTGQVLIFTSRKSKETKVYTRTYADGLWSEWSSLVRAGMYNNISTTDKLLATVESLVDENTRAKEVEESVKRTAVDLSSLACTADNENVIITANSMDGEVLHSVEIPTVTTEQAGVMSVEDKKKIDNFKKTSVTDGDCCDFSIVDEKYNAILILSDGHIRTRNFDSRASVKYIDRDIYALGDSTTQGAGSGDTSVLGSKSWFDRLVAKIQFRSYRKLAANGTVTMKQEGLGALSSQIKYLPVVGNPIILVMIGTNDINKAHTKGDANSVLAMHYEDLSETVSFAEAFRYNLETIKRRLPNAEIIAMMPLSPQLADESDAEMYRDIERTICRALSIPVLEVRNECGISKYCNYGFAQVAEDEIENAVVFMADALHPNNAGYERIANYVAVKLNKYIQ